MPPPPVYEVRIRALLDGDQVVLPGEDQPPELGSGSAATGEMSLVLTPGIDPLGLDNRFSLDLTVRGIALDQLDTSQTDNETAVHIHQGGPGSIGPMLIDAHYYALDESIPANGITPTEDGFELHADGLISEEQGDLAEGFSMLEIVDLLRSEDAYIVVRTTTDPLFGEGEIRGNLRVVPERIRLTAMLDEGQVVRPPEFRPPELGTGSPATGEATLSVNTFTSRFSFDLAARGIDGAKLDDRHGQNLTAIQIRSGGPEATGEIILDVHHFSRLARPDTNGISPAPGGFALHAEGNIAQVQGDHDTGLAVAAIIDRLRNGGAYIDIRTTTE
ncbi:MAG: CHRD domain-containing protein, partial [Candidatus Binatia bacterium]